MTHNIRGFSAPISNSNVANLYGEVNITVDDVETLISPLLGALPSYPSNDGEIVAMVSDNAADVGLVEISGLDTEFKSHRERVQINGLTPVQTTKLFTRINNISWLEPTAFQGFIRITNIGDTSNYRSASPEAQISLDMFYSVPSDRKWVVDSIYSAITRDSGGQATSTVSIYFRPVGFAFRRAFKFATVNTGNSSNFYPNAIPSQGSGPADFYLTAFTTDASGGTPAEVVARMCINMVTA